MGDQLLEVNGISFRQLTREHAVLNLMSLPVGGEVCIVAQSKPRHYESILERGTGDSFYIRTHFKRDAAQSHELGFKKGQGKKTCGQISDDVRSSHRSMKITELLTIYSKT